MLSILPSCPTTLPTVLYSAECLCVPHVMPCGCTVCSGTCACDGWMVMVMVMYTWHVKVVTPTVRRLLWMSLGCHWTSETMWAPNRQCMSSNLRRVMCIPCTVLYVCDGRFWRGCLHNLELLLASHRLCPLCLFLRFQNFINCFPALARGHKPAWTFLQLSSWRRSLVCGNSDAMSVRLSIILNCSVVQGVRQRPSETINK